MLLCTLFIGCKSSDTKARSDYQDVLLELHNEKRLKHGLKPLSLDEKLCEYAQKHANNMALKNSMYHSDISGVRKLDPNKNWKWTGENVAWGQTSEESVVNSWMWSPGHRWNILGQEFKKVGFGLAKDSKGYNYWCVVFAD